MGKVGLGTILTLAILVGLLVLAILFMIVGWGAPDDGTERGTEMSGAGWIAMVFGVIVTLALGSGLMALMFYSNRSGRDE